MRTIPGSWLKSTGFAFMLVGVGVNDAVGSGEVGVLLVLGLVCVLAGANLLTVGLLMVPEEEVPTAPIGPAAFARVGELAAFLRRNLDVVGLILASSAVSAVAGGEVGPILCLAMFALFLPGLCFMGIRVLGEG